MRHGRLLAGVLAAAALGTALVTAAAPAQQAPQGLSGWDGSNPFDCEIQDVGFGTDFPDPGADPFCVQFDKTRQNVTELGVVEFLLQEPARVAAAVDKCFYYQRDSWRGSIVQGNGATETYNFDGRYYFDKARGAGGVYVENFRILGQSGDPTLLPGFPPEYKPFFGKGRGGAQAVAGIQADPRCVAAAGAVDSSGPASSNGAGGAAAATGEGDESDGDPAGSAGAGASGGGGDAQSDDPRFAESRGSPSFAG